jgi:prolyl oligopeptidase
MLRADTRREPVVEVLHGVEVDDPYRWLEDGESAEVASGSRPRTRSPAQPLTRPPDPSIRAARSTADHWRRRRSHHPAAHFYQRRDGRRDPPVLVVRDTSTGDERTIDPNTLSERGVVALDWWVPSIDGALLAYGTSEGGTESARCAS